ncbi:hypothetical protein FRC09_012600 [Ceratobasidium sp. 395]|nr:hypothetical protein FRC09_012600 [Ceratobasidium sp. 395]
MRLAPLAMFPTPAQLIAADTPTLPTIPTRPTASDASNDAATNDTKATDVAAAPVIAGLRDWYGLAYRLLLPPPSHPACSDAL